jgi:hypothetical protein
MSYKELINKYSGFLQRLDKDKFEAIANDWKGNEEEAGNYLADHALSMFASDLNLTVSEQEQIKMDEKFHEFGQLLKQEYDRLNYTYRPIGGKRSRKRRTNKKRRSRKSRKQRRKTRKH